MKRWFITGTDTDIGKTTVTAQLARGLRVLKREVLAVKPLMSGAKPEDSDSDAAVLGVAAGHPPLVHTWWETPISPHRAAWQEDKRLDIPSLRVWLRGHIAEHVLIEGVGGWRVPLVMTPTGQTLYTVRDLARDSAGEVLLVAANRLGVLNHTQLTVEAIERDGFVVRGVILNQIHSGTRSVSEKTNLDDLRRILTIPVAPCPLIDDDETRLSGDIGLNLWRDLALL